MTANILGSHEPFFSIIIPAYNAETYIDQCLASVQRQPFCNYEVVLVDDGSTDQTEEICSRYCAASPKFILIKKNNQGCFRARLEAMRVARGRYFLFLDSDDLLAPNALESVYNALAETGYPDVLFFESSSCYGDLLSRLKTASSSPKHCTKLKLDECRRNILSAKNNTLWGKAISKNACTSAIDEPTDLSISHGEDLVQLLNILDKCSNVYKLSLPLYYYRINPESATSSYDVSQLYSLEVVFSTLQKYGKKWQCEYFSWVGSAFHFCSTFKIFWNDQSDTNITTFNKFSELVSRNARMLKVDVSDIGLNNYILLRSIFFNSYALTTIILLLEKNLKHIAKRH